MSNSTATALATASAATVYAVAAAVKADTTATTLVQGRTTYTVTTLGTRVVDFDGGRVRFQLVMEVTRTTSRSTKTFQAHVSVDNYTGYTGELDTLRVNTMYNENGNAVYAAEFDGYRAAAMAHAVQVTTTALEAQETATQENVQETATAQAQENVQETATAQETTTTVESIVTVHVDPETGIRTMAPEAALEDTTVETVLDPETGGRTLAPEVREALRRGPAQDQETPAQESRQGTVPTDAEREAALDQFRRETASLAEAALAREAGLKDTLAQSVDHLQAAAQARHDHLAEWEAHIQEWLQGQAESHHAGAAQIAHTRYRRAMRAYWDGVAPTSHGDLHHLKQAAESGDLADVERHLDNLRAAGLLG